MKKHFFGIILLVVASLSFAFIKSNKAVIKKEKYVNTHFKNANGAPNGNTGAPGENNCTQCHSGSMLDGSEMNLLEMFDNAGNLVNTYLPDSTYNMKFTSNSPAIRKGFQTVVLNTSNTQSGTLNAITTEGTKKNTAGGTNGRQYITHTLNGTSLSTWGFTWKAPSTSQGDVTFYLASNVTNNNNSSSGDQIYLSQHTYSLEETNSTNFLNKTKSFSFIAFYYEKHLHLKFNSQFSGHGFVNVLNSFGQSVFYSNLGQINTNEEIRKILLPSNLNKGIYFVHVFVNNNSATRKIIVE
jgi:hypothetical protein